MRVGWQDTAAAPGLAALQAAANRITKRRGAAAVGGAEVHAVCFPECTYVRPGLPERQGAGHKGPPGLSRSGWGDPLQLQGKGEASIATAQKKMRSTTKQP